MASCEKCWRDSGGDPHTYKELILERQDNPCTPEEQAGDGDECPTCKRMTVHMHVHRCVICGFDVKQLEIVAGEIVFQREIVANIVNTYIKSGSLEKCMLYMKDNLYVITKGDPSL